MRNASILIAGGTGLIGQSLLNLLCDKKIEVKLLTTSKKKMIERRHLKSYYWNPQKKIIDLDCLKNTTAIVNLAGANISKRWTASYKQKIIESRLQSLDFLYDTLKSNKHQIKHIVSASGISIYPSSLDKLYVEESQPPSDDFLGDLVQKWEKAVLKFDSLNLDTTILRIGVVLSEKGGALLKILTLLKYYLGAVFGKGNQWQSWIHIEDLALMFEYILIQKLSGIFNAVASETVSHQRFMDTCGQLLKRPILIRIPKPMGYLIFGEMAQLLYDSQNVSNDKIIDMGFRFRYPKLEDALKQIIT